MKIKYSLLLIIILGFILRIAFINELPAILNRDEAAIAYNAYLLSETGTDEWREPINIALESFGDYKLFGYPITVALLFKILPVTDLTVKIPSLLAGSLLPLVIFLLSRNFNLSKRYSLLTAFFIATNPVFIFYSRMAFEANVGLFLFSIGLTLITYETKNIRRVEFDLIGTLVFLLATFFYNTPLLLLPFVIVLLPVYRGLNQPKKWILPVVSLSIIFGSVFTLLLPLTSRKADVTLFSDSLVRKEYIDYHASLGSIKRIIFGSKYFYFLIRIMENIYKSFTPFFLVENGGPNPWHSIVNWGHLTWIVYLSSLLGIFVKIKSFFSKKLLLNKQKNIINKHKKTIFMILLMIASLAPSVITVDAPHATRSLFFFIMLTIFAGFGLENLEYLVKKTLSKNNSFCKRTLVCNIKSHFHLLIILFSLLITIDYSKEYLTKFELDHRRNFKTGFDTLVIGIDSKYSDREIAIVDPEGYQYIVLSWYLKIDPELFFSTIIRQNPNQIGFRYGQQVKNYHFIADDEDRSNLETVLIQWNQEKNIWEFEKF